MMTLVVDDDEVMRELLTYQLTTLGVGQVVACEHAVDAVELLEAPNASVGLILCDLQMPEMDGVEFVRSLARIRYEGGLILVSGEDVRILQTAEKLARAHRLDVLGTMQKPIALARLRPLLEQRTWGIARSPQKICKTYAAEELRCAIAAGQLVNHYQPKVDLSTGALAGVETLVRWLHPKDGLIMPNQFIETAEGCELIDELTCAVLTAAFAQLRRWKDAGLDLHVAVNVSMENLRGLDFPDRVDRWAHEAGVDVRDLILEVTESRLLRDPRSSLDILTRLRLKHIGLSIDDFGTGHSSLAQLRDIPFDELKIDRGFVHGASHDQSLRTFFDASLDMAQRLGMRTVAEGIEDREDWDFLRSTGCDFAQGWFIGRPMPADALGEWIGVWDARRVGLTASGT